MKKLTLLILSLLIVSLSSGCDNKTNVTELNPPATIDGKGYTKNYTIELDDVMKNIEQNNSFTSALPTEYELTATINLAADKDADRIVYEIFVKKPKVQMRNLMMSFSLNPDMLTKLNTSDVFVSNALNEEQIDYSPNSDTNGISLYRAFVLDKTLLDTTVTEVFTELYVKISYTDSSNTLISDYIKMQAEPSKEILDYINNQIAK
ncbi:hypothetical protein C162_26235 [Paenibacillus sp. FSL R7-269]|uniref:hypothetical protein n=1 Tax=Paenibacillus sp. FSL R7-269 TaxID=1226755 RepID=UPI0003E1C77A|nr:hypothetical protein [Paenibacillus sp. FSL R7-269]ETT41447.1 hypothetical protein C162_26235 [Paenibacillus sp. FSL R7-269]